MENYLVGFIAYLKKKSLSTPRVLIHEYFNTFQMSCVYELTDAKGPPHAQTFEYRLLIKQGNQIVIQSYGGGTTKSHAKHMAAYAMVMGLKGHENDDQWPQNSNDPVARNGVMKETKLNAPNVSKIVKKTNKLAGPQCDNNSVTKLHEFCTKRGIPLPKYVAYPVEQGSKLPKFGVTCVVEDYQEIGVGGSKKGAKWEACTKMLATLSDAATPNLKRVKQEHASGTNGHQFPPLGDDVLELLHRIDSNKPISSPITSLADLDYKQHGIRIVEKVAPSMAITKILTTIFNYVNTFAGDLEMTQEDYLAIVSIWKQPSALVLALANWAEYQLKDVAVQTAKAPVKMHKIAIINEGRLGATHTMPAHQDIAFTPDDPYEFSILLPLTSVSKSTGAVQFLPGSHQSSISPPVDIFNPNFTDNVCTSDQWKNNAIPIPTNAGGCIVFDSRIWYRFVGNREDQVRFSVMTYWRISDVEQQLPATLAYETESNWSDNDTILKVLYQGLVKVNEKLVDIDPDEKMNEYLYKWRDILLQNQKSQLFKMNGKDLAVNAIIDFLVIHQTSVYHSGDSMNGEVYSKLWSTFLQPLRKCLMLD